ncbi:alpha/beta hydrolase [Mycetocola zhujimingii]|uniref:alpha/beta hydrolase n=1 Tax=Mycetocola zhujimingii TaxID=2079792 RepID=UPI000D350E0B|nr:alpha/beta hydrolase [Mycetocola zhujimingii]AWB87534.1 hypothetical protein C3E77_13590 [Mycetocola zhujimingii]
MSDALTVSTGGLTSVSTEELFVFASALDVFAADATDWAHAASIARCLTEWSTDAAPYGFAEPALLQASRSLAEASECAERLGSVVQEAANAYADGEARSREALGAMQAFAGFLVGTYLRNLVIGALPLLPGLILTATVMKQPAMRRAVAVLGGGLAGGLVQNPGLTANPAFVGMVRDVVSAADDILMGFSGTSLPAARFLGDEGTGLVGLETVAGAAIILGGRHAFTETPVRTSRHGEVRETRPPASLAEAARRIPPTGVGKPQITVEKYRHSSGADSYAVYIAGTTDFGGNSAEPFDMASNLAAVADSDAGAYTATLDAMEQAGVQPGDRVSLFGHSQGGLVAARIAESESFDTQALVTFGSPSGQVAVPDSVTQVAVEHAEDLVPALGGEPVDGAEGRDRLVVSRAIFDDTPSGADDAGAAHSMDGYEATAALIDDSTDSRLTGLTEALAGIGSGAGAAQAFRAERVRSG